MDWLDWFGVGLLVASHVLAFLLGIIVGQRHRDPPSGGNGTGEGEQHPVVRAAL